jgi:hypothetical protein
VLLDLFHNSTCLSINAIVEIAPVLFLVAGVVGQFTLLHTVYMIILNHMEPQTNEYEFVDELHVFE